MMKRFIAFSIIVTVFAGVTPAFADMYTVTSADAMGFSLQFVSAGDSASLIYKGYNPGVNNNTVNSIPESYGAVPMLGAVGFSGSAFVQQNATDKVASFGIGGASPDLSSYTGFRMAIANDDNQTWAYQLYAKYSDSSYQYSSWETRVGSTESVPGYLSYMSLDFSSASAITEFGFILKFDKALAGAGTNYSDDYHASVVAVPVPAALLIGLLGLGTAGIKLRKYA